MNKEIAPNIQATVDSYLCNSCGACYAVCPKGAILYRESTGGYLFPQIDEYLCNHCGLCYKVCPGLGFGQTLKSTIPENPFVGSILSCEVGRAADDNIFTNSQSGGVATALVSHLFETKKIEAAIVAVMKEGQPPRGDVLLLQKKEDLYLAQKSKYTPTPILKALQNVKSIDGDIAVIGLPCHMHGLYNILDLLSLNSKRRFYKIGLICDRVLTSAAIDYMGSYASDAPVTNFVFRDKAQPSYPGNPVVYTNKKSIVLKASLRMAVKDLFTPARCRLCFDKLNVYADVVLGDPHGIDGIDRMHGETLCMVRTEQGKAVVDGAKTRQIVLLHEVPFEQAVLGQGIDKKRKEWQAYMAAWKSLGNPIPEYTLSFKFVGNLNDYKKWIKHALSLDRFESRRALMRRADLWIFRKKVFSKLKWPFSKTKRMLSNLIKRMSR